jgi:hypothetical protein
VLPLDSPKWSALTGAYGSATEIPGLLRDLESLPSNEGQEAEPYFSFWSALCHQGDVYTASYAAVPHMVRIMQTAPARVPWTLFLMLTCIEIARSNGRGPTIPPDLDGDYAAALAQVPDVVAIASKANWDHWYCGAALAAVAASKGFCRLAEAIMELAPETIEDMLRRKFGKE